MHNVIAHVARLARTSPLLVPVALTLSLAACGSDDDTQDEITFIPTVESTDPPVTYLTDDLNCLVGVGEPQPLLKSTIYAWQGDEVVRKQVDFTGIENAESLNSDLVSVTTWKDQFERICDYSRPRGRECVDANGREKGWVKSGSGGNLRICEPGRAFARESYEGVGLTSFYFLQRAHETYKAVAEDQRVLPQIVLSVLPRFVDFYENYYVNGRRSRLATYITHNMAYFPRSGETPPIIAVFPEDEGKRAEAKGFFWESSFVLAHEYAHHIDFARSSGAALDMGLSWNPIRHAFEDVALLQQGFSGDSDKAKIRGSVAEGFADLLAYYAAGAKSDGLIGMPCFGRNRDVGNDRFYDGEHDPQGDAKILTEDRLGALLGYVALQEDDCGKPNYRDIHTIGAILANALDGVFARLNAATDQFQPQSPEDITERYRLALAWNDAFLASLSQVTPAAEGATLLEPLSVALEQIADLFLRHYPLRNDPDASPAVVRRDICELVKAKLPASPKAPYQHDSGC